MTFASGFWYNSARRTGIVPFRPTRKEANMSSKKAQTKAPAKKVAPQKKPAEKPVKKAPAKKLAKAVPQKPAKKAPAKKPAKARRPMTEEQRERKNRLARERRAARKPKANALPKAKSRGQGKPAAGCGGSCGTCGGCGAIRRAFADAPKAGGCRDSDEPVRMTAEEARQVRDAAAMVAAALDCALDALRDVREAAEFGRLFDEVSRVVDGGVRA